MASTKFIVQKYPYEHPAGQAPVNSEVDLSHLTPAEIQRLLDRRLMIPKGDYTPPEPEPEPEPVIKLNSRGEPYGTRKEAAKAAKPKEK